DSTYAIAANSKNPAAAWEFIKHMTSYDAQKLIVENWPFFITRKDVWSEIGKGEIKNSADLMVALEQSQRPNAYDPYKEMPPQLFEAVDAFRAEMHRVILGEKAPQEAMDAVAAAWEQLYADWEDTYGELGDRYTR
ncbi:MAG: ABC transporter substrate-binding protein, partial [Candidatus Binatia bacterium]